jgi:SAM-dependent methyltransferase
MMVGKAVRRIPLLIARQRQLTICLMNPTYNKPSGLTPEYGAQFQDAAIVKAYKHREPYPYDTFSILHRLACTSAPVVADIGCGPGDLTLGLSKFASRVDAVDLSEEMINEAKRSSANIGNINWLCGPAENAPLQGPYDLITAADSIHWMEWDVLFRNIRMWLRPEKFFCVVGRWYEKKDWWDSDFQSLINTHSTNKDFKKYDIVEELGKSGYVKIVASEKTPSVPFTQSVDELIEAFHSRNGFSRDRMGSTANLFDRDARAHLNRFAVNGELNLFSAAQVTWMTVN